MGKTQTEIIADKKNAVLQEKNKIRQGFADAAPPIYGDFWKDEAGEALIPAYPLKPFISLRFLSSIVKSERRYDEIFDVPYNFIQNFSVVSYPTARASITLRDTEFVNIEALAFRALSVYNEEIRKTSLKYTVPTDPLSVPAFCKLSWGWEGTGDERITSDVQSFILIGFKYNVQQTFLEIQLELIGNSNYFFDVTQIGNKTDLIDPGAGAEKKDGEYTIHEYITTFLKRFNLDIDKHYKLDDTFNSEDMKFEPKAFSLRPEVAPHLKPDVSLSTFVQNVCSITGYTIEHVMSKPGDKDAQETYGLVRMWVPKYYKGQLELIRTYEWRDTPTSVIQSLQATIPEGYFLGQTNLNLLGYTFDDDGNISLHVVKHKEGFVQDIKQVAAATSIAQIRFEIDKAIKGDSSALLSDDNIKKYKNVIKAYDDASASNFEGIENAAKDKLESILGPLRLRADDYGKITVDESVAKEVEGLRRDLERAEAARKIHNAELGEQSKKAEDELRGEIFPEYLRTHSEFVPINLSTGGTEGETLQTKAEQDRWLLTNLLNTISNDMVLRLQVSILGDPYLDGSRYELSKSKVRVIVNRPDGQPSVLSNDYIFYPSNLTHNISASGYTTSMTLMTAKESAADVEETIKLY